MDEWGLWIESLAVLALWRVLAYGRLERCSSLHQTVQG